jgi:hypothetical protein
MTRVPESDKAFAKAAASAFGGTPSVHRHWDEDESHHVDILSCTDTPADGLSTYSTLGLRHVPVILEERTIPVELVGVGPTDASAYPNVLATSAFFVMKERWLCAPGVVFPDVVAEYELSEHLRHVLWLDPSPWPELGALTVGTETAHWLLALPISELERKRLVEVGLPQFEALLDGVDYWDLQRPPIV